MKIKESDPTFIKQGRLQGGLNKNPGHHALPTKCHHQKLLERILFMCRKLYHYLTDTFVPIDYGIEFFTITWIKWGDTPLALLFLSPISMFSFTFLILTALGIL